MISQETIAAKPPRAWFDLGVQALEKKFPHIGLPKGYVCPLCIVIKNSQLSARVFYDPAGLTKEHVPPGNFGGKEMVLTCPECNSPAGHTVDAHLGKLREMIAPSKAVKGKVTVSGEKFNALIDVANRRLEVSWKHNHSDKVHEFIERAKKDQSIQLELRQPKYDSRRGRVSLLRASYLAAFAALGYSYIFADSLEPVREQIRTPDSDVIKIYGAKIKDADIGFRRLGIVAKPQEFFKAVVVQIGPFLTLLPPPSKRTDFHDQIGEGLFVRFECRYPPWPKGPVFFYDFSD
jgi:hypothetical protein